MDASKNSHVKDQFVKRAMVWYEGTDALAEGEAVCYNILSGTATETDGRRSSHVIRPTAATADAFAGVAARNYPAKTGGQFVEINLPGSRSVIVALSTGNTTIGVTNLVFLYGTGAGKFVANTAVGQGSALATQTTTGASKVQAVLGEGAQSGGVDGDV